MFIKYFPLLILISGCTYVSPWRVESIAAGDKTFDSSRMRYQNLFIATPLLFEFLRVGDGLEAYLCLTQFRWNPSPENPQAVKAQFIIDGETTEVYLPLLEGRMKLRLPTELTTTLILALQDGKKVGILIDGFEETLDPENFNRSYNKFLKNRVSLQSIFKGPVQ
jgi:hypothetical protein